MAESMLPRPITNHAELSLLTASDAAELFALCLRNRERLGEFLPWADATQSPADVARFIESAAAQYNAGLGLHAGIREGKKLLGCVGMHPIDTANRSAAIGYWIDMDAGGFGLASAAVEGLVRICFEHYQLHRVEIRCATHNRRSQALAERLGFRQEGILRGAQLVRGQYLDQYVYGRLATDEVEDEDARASDR